MFSLSPAASQLLKIYDKTFLDVVNPKLSLLKLEHKGVISLDAATAIDNANEEDAKYLLFQHLEKNATVDTLREYCKVAIAADGYPRMQKLGRKMMETLPLGGLSHLWWWVGTLSALHVCVPLSHCGICMYCTGLHTKCTALAVHCHIQFCCSNQFAPFAPSPCTASTPHPPPVMTEPHPMAKHRPTRSPHNERKCLLSILPHVNSCELKFGSYGSRVMMS